MATYGPNVLEWIEVKMLENKLTQNLLAIPCDQRLCEEEMKRIMNIVKL